MAFFSSDKLTSAERQELMNYPKDEMRRKLFQWYVKRELGVDLPSMRRRGEGPPQTRGQRGARGPRAEGNFRGPDHGGLDHGGLDQGGPDYGGPGRSGPEMRRRGKGDRGKGGPNNGSNQERRPGETAPNG